jgi:hypothetical protein
MGDRRIKTENELAMHVIGELREDGWTVYEEVQSDRGGAIADIVAERGGFLHVIETKLSLSLAVIEQAYHWTSYAHAVSIAFARFRPQSRHFYNNPKGQSIACLMCRRLGVGVLQVTERENEHFENRVDVARLERGSFHRPIFGQQLRNVLQEQLLAKGDAGKNGGGYWTPFKQTCDELRKVVIATPGITMKAAIDSIDHHYSKDATAVACLSKYLNDGILKGIRTERIGRTVHLYSESSPV